MSDATTDFYGTWDGSMLHLVFNRISVEAFMADSSLTVADMQRELPGAVNRSRINELLGSLPWISPGKTIGGDLPPIVTNASTATGIADAIADTLWNVLNRLLGGGGVLWAERYRSGEMPSQFAEESFTVPISSQVADNAVQFKALPPVYYGENLREHVSDAAIRKAAEDETKMHGKGQAFLFSTQSELLEDRKKADKARALLVLALEGRLADDRLIDYHLEQDLITRAQADWLRRFRLLLASEQGEALRQYLMVLDKELGWVREETRAVAIERLLANLAEGLGGSVAVRMAVLEANEGFTWTGIAANLVRNLNSTEKAAEFYKGIYATLEKSVLDFAGFLAAFADALNQASWGNVKPLRDMIGSLISALVELVVLFASGKLPDAVKAGLVKYMQSLENAATPYDLGKAVGKLLELALGFVGAGVVLKVFARVKGLAKVGKAAKATFDPKIEAARKIWKNDFGSWLVRCERLKNNPVPDTYKKFISQERIEHILLGDGPKYGGHLYPSAIGKSAFPKSWEPEKIIRYTMEVATDSRSTWKQLSGPKGKIVTKSGAPVRVQIEGVREGIRIRVIAEPYAGGKGIITAFPPGF